MSVDNAARTFLNNFLKLRMQIEDNSPMATEDVVVTLADTHIVENVILSRASENSYRFFGGTVGKGDRQRPVWVADMKQARAVSGDMIHLYEEKLGEELIPLWPYAR